MSWCSIPSAAALRGWEWSQGMALGSPVVPLLKSTVVVAPAAAGVARSSARLPPANSSAYATL